MPTKPKDSPDFTAAIEELSRRQAIVDQLKAERDASWSANAADIVGEPFQAVASARPARPNIEAELAAAEEAVREQTATVDWERRKAMALHEARTHPERRG